jgi:ATP-binding protein involved in chromosome partitioning
VNISEELILSVLSKVIHPAAQKSIVELGMIHDLHINQNQITFTIFSNKVKDPLLESIKKVCINVIKKEVSENIEINILTQTKQIVQEESKDILPHAKNIIAISSGKGGVGKSTIASNMAVALAALGYKTGLIDADIFGPSIPKMFDLENIQIGMIQKGNRNLIVPAEKYGVKLLSVGFFVKPEDATIWRGPMASNVLKQLITEADWGELDFLLFDLPPGTSDIHLTLVQTLALTGAVVVSTPQTVALADAIKGIQMFRSEKINVPILGLVENMAWFTPAELPNNKYYIFGKDGCKALAEKENIPLIGQIPIVQNICESGDKGKPEALNQDSIIGKEFIELAKKLVIETAKRNLAQNPTNKVKITSVK